MKIKVVNKSKHKLMEYTTEHTTGYERDEWIDRDKLLRTERSEGEFGHTVKN